MSGLLSKIGHSDSEREYGEYRIKPFQNESPYYYNNDNGMNHLLDHLEQVMDGELEIDFQSGEISNVTEPPEIIKLSGASKLPVIGIVIMVLGIISPIFILIGFLFCFIGWIPMMLTLVLLAFGGDQEKHRNEIIEEIEIGGGVYRHGGISGIINGLDTYFHLTIEHDEVSIMKAWEISPVEELNINSVIYSYGGSDGGGITSRFMASFTPLSSESVTSLGDSHCPHYGNSKKQVNLACKLAVEFGLKLKPEWPGKIVLKSIPQIDEILRKSVVNQNKLFKIISKIDPENLSDLESTFHEVEFLNY
jgi:preprotein translocase subunit YajC